MGEKFCRTQSDTQVTSMRNKLNGREGADKSKEKTAE